MNIPEATPKDVGGDDSPFISHLCLERTIQRRYLGRHQQMSPFFLKTMVISFPCLLTQGPRIDHNSMGTEDPVKRYHGNIISKIQNVGNFTHKKWLMSWTNKWQKKTQKSTKEKIYKASIKCTRWTFFESWFKHISCFIKKSL